MKIFYIILLIVVISNVQSDSDLDVIASLDTPTVSGGWSSLNIKTVWGDEICFSYNEKKEGFNKILIKNNKKLIELEKKYLNPIKSPDLGTLNDIWFIEKSHEIYNFNFEFRYLKMEDFKKRGRFKVKFIFVKSYLEQVIVEEYDSKIESWNYLFDLVVKFDKL